MYVADKKTRIKLIHDSASILIYYVVERSTTDPNIHILMAQFLSRKDAEEYADMKNDEIRDYNKFNAKVAPNNAEYVIIASSLTENYEILTESNFLSYYLKNS